MAYYGHSRLGLASVIFRISKHLPKLLLLGVCECLCVCVRACL